MANKLTALILLLAFIAISTFTSTVTAQYHLDSNRYGPGSLKIYQCPSECARRCKQTQYKKACLTFCNKCCNKCLCVPPATTATRVSALATTTGRLRKEDQNALDHHHLPSLFAPKCAAI
ncbi:UNVERIFIED_CONTAM: Gibberellin-regulated protein 4 [Sesamum angustifolium]|uniref:Gibberellin-regulated protein 4 n=1 Tax=Sesamum angustifolium TaxID=2727405 RepID=A0AAW2IPP8_9LAMI